MPWRGSNCTCRFQADTLDERRAPDGDEHEVGLDRLAFAEVHIELRAVVVHLRALLAEVERDARLPNCFASSFVASASSWDERVEHLDDRHFGAEPLEDRPRTRSR